MQIPILNGVYADQNPDFRTSYPRNLIPVPKQTGVAQGYLKPADGIVEQGTGPGLARGGINWNGTEYRVMGTKLVSISKTGVVSTLGDVGGAGPVTMDYSFDRLGIASGGHLFYWNGSTLTQVTDPDIGLVLDVKFIAGYWMTTDGSNLIVTDLTDPTSVNPLKYGSAESDPDPVKAVDEMRNEAYALGRYTIQLFQNVGGNNFPFAALGSADIAKGVIGTHAYCSIGNTFVFLGSGRGEAPAVYMVVPGDVRKLSTREIDVILESYSEDELSQVVMECTVSKNHQHVYMHLPNQTWVYDTMATQATGEPVWFSLDSGMADPSQYRARDFVWCYDRWKVADPTTGKFGYMSADTGSHYGAKNCWEFGTLMVYNQGDGGIIHELELCALPGRVALGDNPTVWTSYSLDGETWSQERPKSAGKQGEQQKRLIWRDQGSFTNYRIQKFRGMSDARVAVGRLEAKIEGLFTKPGVRGG